MNLTDMNNSEQNIEKIIYLMQTDRAIDAPADAIKWTQNLFKTRVPVEEAGLFKTIVAVLTQDFSPGTAARGERSGSAGLSQQLLFEAGENSIDLRVTTADGLFDIRGQILGDNYEGLEVSLDEHVATTDEMGSFSLTGIKAGSYQITIKGAGLEIVLKNINLS